MSSLIQPQVTSLPWDVDLKNKLYTIVTEPSSNDKEIVRNQHNRIIKLIKNTLLITHEMANPTIDQQVYLIRDMASEILSSVHQPRLAQHIQQTIIGLLNQLTNAQYPNEWRPDHFTVIQRQMEKPSIGTSQERTDEILKSCDIQTIRKEEAEAESELDENEYDEYGFRSEPFPMSEEAMSELEQRKQLQQEFAQHTEKVFGKNRETYAQEERAKFLQHSKSAEEREVVEVVIHTQHSQAQQNQEEWDLADLEERERDAELERLRTAPKSQEELEAMGRAMDRHQKYMEQLEKEKLIKAAKPEHST